MKIVSQLENNKTEIRRFCEIERNQNLSTKAQNYLLKCLCVK